MIHGHEYSLYSDAPASRIGVYGVIGITAVAIVAAIRASIFGYWLAPNEPIPNWVFYLGSVTPLVMFGLLLFLFDRFACHWPLSKPVYILGRDKAPPYIQGTYKGSVTYRCKIDKIQKTSQATVSIVQRWNRLVVIFEFFDEQQNKRAGSHSDMAYIQQGLYANMPILRYTYSYEGVEPSVEGGIHTSVLHGTATLEFKRVDDNWSVVGSYYSDDAGSGIVSLVQTIEPTSLGWLDRMSRL